MIKNLYQVSLYVIHAYKTTLTNQEISVTLFEHISVEYHRKCARIVTNGIDIHTKISVEKVEKKNGNAPHD